MNQAEQIIRNSSLTIQQKIIQLAAAAENSLNLMQPDRKSLDLMRKGILCDMNEGAAPYRPRYVVPDYEKFLKEGSAFLQLDPPRNLEEALAALLILYHHVPSITAFPVYIGNLDTLLNPYLSDPEKDLPAIKRFLTHIDRTMTDSFLHANIGPDDSPAARLILRAERELGNAVPNLTLKTAASTPDSLLLEAASAALEGAKPCFANHELFKSEFGNSYAIVSCYNGLPRGGGSYSLARLNLAALAEGAKSVEEFLSSLLPEAAEALCIYLDERIRFIVEESRFFDSSFLVKEGLLLPEKMTAMAGMFGLAECVNTLRKTETREDRFGHSGEANRLGLQIIETLDEAVRKHRNPHCPAFDGRFLLHAQVGLDTDNGTSPGCRIPIGDEPELPQHLLMSAPFHSYFPSGIGDVFTFETTAKKNPRAVVDILRGAFAQGMRHIALYGADSDVIRITGYLVKKSEIEKLRTGQPVLHDTVALGMGNVDNSRTLERKIR